jgi:hypothetical protein
MVSGSHLSYDFENRDSEIRRLYQPSEVAHTCNSTTEEAEVTEVRGLPV